MLGLPNRLVVYSVLVLSMFMHVVIFKGAVAVILFDLMMLVAVLVYYRPISVFHNDLISYLWILFFVVLIVVGVFNVVKHGNSGGWIKDVVQIVEMLLFYNIVRFASLQRGHEYALFRVVY